MTGSQVIDKLYRPTLIALMALSIAFSVYALFIKLNGPILDAFGFRQTQTAISIFYMLKGGPILGYETPVLGYPWAIPFEFPVYHSIVAAFSYFFGHLDATGRLVSYAFFILCAYPIAGIYKLYAAPRYALPMTIIFALGSPLYLLYSRAFLIETTALFFSLMWLWLFCSEMKRHENGVALLCLVFGILAVLTKSTTFLSVTLFGFAIMMQVVIERARLAAYREVATVLVLAAAITLIPIAIGYAWVVWTDQVKMMNPFGYVLTSASLQQWNFARPGQRTSAEVWKVFTQRVPIEMFGYASLAALFPIGAGIAWKQTRLLTVAALVTFMGTLLIFTNLQFVHNYYQTSIAIFAMMACALGICAIAERGSKLLALIILIGISASQLHHSYKTVFPFIGADHKQSQLYKIGKMARMNIAPDDALIVFGMDWSSEIPYYAERKAIGVPGWISDAQLTALARTPQNFLGGLHLGGVIVCDPVGRPAMKAALTQMIAGMSIKGEAGACKLYTPGQ